MGLGPGICVKYFLSLPQKNPVTRENWNKPSVYFSIFQLWNWPKHPFCQISLCQIVFFCTAQKLKSKQYVCPNFFGDRFFLSEQEKIFYTYSGLSTKLDKRSMTRLSHFWLKNIMDEAKMKNGSLSNRAQSHPLIKFCSKLKIGYHHSIYIYLY